MYNYYAEKMIDGHLYFRSAPNGKWEKVTANHAIEMTLKKS